MAVLNTEHTDMSFAIKGNAERRGILPVGTDTIECAVNIQRDFAFDVTIANVAFAAEWAAASEAGLILEMNSFSVRRRPKRRQSARSGSRAHYCGQAHHGGQACRSRQSAHEIAAVNDGATRRFL